jgi:hypothetical protein
MAQQGEAAGYYNNTPQNNNHYHMQQPAPYPPPQYGQGIAPPPGPPPQQNGYGQQSYGEKSNFDQKFKIAKPKWNDLWAGILVCVPRSDD